MNEYEKEVLLDKLNTNLKRQNHLKILLLICISIDICAYVILESIELAFAWKTFGIVFYFLSKIVIVLIVGVLIFYAIKKQKMRLLLVNALVYLILGLALFFYLIVKEMEVNVNSGGMKPITDSKPEVYYTVFLKIIICLNIIAGVFRLLGGIFIFVFLKIWKKTEKINEKLNEKLIDHCEGTNLQDQEVDRNVIRVFTKIKSGSNSIVNPKTQTLHSKGKNSTFTEGAKTKYTTDPDARRNILSPKSSINANKTNISDSSIVQDVSIIIQNGDSSNSSTNNIHVHVYNYNMPPKNKNKSKLAPISANTIESCDDREKEEITECMYETPRKGSLADTPETAEKTD